MRHYFLPGAIASRPLRMHHATTAGALIALGRRVTMVTAGFLRAACPAVDLAAVAPSADQHLDPAASAIKEPGGDRRAADSAAPEVDGLFDRWDTALVIVLSTVQGAAPM